MRLGDLDAVMKRLDKVCVTDDCFGMGVQVGIDHGKDVIKDALTIDPDTLRPKGRWIMHDDELGLTCECSVCHIETCGDSPYCPNCGAKMEV